MQAADLKQISFADLALNSTTIAHSKPYQAVEPVMSDEVDSRITPSLHPLNVRQVEGYDEATAPFLCATETVFRQTYEALRDVHNARALAANNPGWTEGQQILQTDALARKHLDKITRAFDTTRGRLIEGITHIERELSTPVASKASLQISQEVRAHCKALTSGAARMDFVRGLINEGDELSASAILGGPSFLSGLNAEQMAVFTRLYHERTSPAAAQRLKAMQGAVALIERNSSLVFKAFSDAVGCPPHKAKALREANTAAERAMVMRDVA